MNAILEQCDYCGKETKTKFPSLGEITRRMKRLNYLAACEECHHIASVLLKQNIKEHPRLTN